MQKKKQLALKRKGLSIETYGYKIAKSDLLITIGVLCVGMFAVCYVHRLNVAFAMICSVTVVFTIPIVISSYFKYKFEQSKFEDYCKYFEYMRIYYKTYKKLKVAWEMTILQFDKKSRMKKCIEKAIAEIETTSNYEKALEYFEDDYGNSYLERFHNLLLIGEQHGAESVYENMDMINYDEWREDMKVLQKGKNKAIKWITGYFVLGLFISMVITQNFLFDISSNLFTFSFYQLYTFIEIECIYLAYIWLFVQLTNKKWIRRDE